MAGHKFLCDLKGAVTAPVLHDQHLGGVILFLKKSKHLLQGVGQARLFVVRRDDDGKEGS